MPEHPCGDGPPRPPRAADGGEPFRAGHFAEPLDLADRDGESEVAAGPYVRAAQRHQQVDVGAPPADSLEREQRGPRALVVERVQRVDLEGAADDRLREGANVRGLLPTESHTLQLIVG